MEVRNAGSGSSDAFTSVASEFATVAGDLDFAARSLDAAFVANAARTATDGDDGGAGAGGGVDVDSLPKPVDVIRRLRAIEAVLPQLQARLGRLARAKRTVAQQLADVVPRAQQAAAALATTVGVEQDSVAERAFVGFSAMLEGVANVGRGVTPVNPPPVPRRAARQESPTTSRRRGGAKQASGQRAEPASSTNARKARPKTPRGGKKRVKKAAKPASVVPQECSEEAFEGVPSLVRGRCKFKDVAQVYATICDIAQSELQQLQAAANSGPARLRPPPVKVSDVPAITVKVLSGKGCKVTGHTGSCVLKSLRNMGLIQITKAGVLLVQE